MRKSERQEGMREGWNKEVRAAEGYAWKLG